MIAASRRGLNNYTSYAHSDFLAALPGAILVSDSILIPICCFFSEWLLVVVLAAAITTHYAGQLYHTDLEKLSSKFSLDPDLISSGNY